MMGRKMRKRLWGFALFCDHLSIEFDRTPRIYIVSGPSHTESFFEYFPVFIMYSLWELKIKSRFSKRSELLALHRAKKGCSMDRTINVLFLYIFCIFSVSKCMLSISLIVKENQIFWFDTKGMQPNNGLRTHLL